MNQDAAVLTLALLSVAAQSVLADEPSTQATSAYLVQGFLESTAEVDFTTTWALFDESLLTEVDEMAVTGTDKAEMPNRRIKRHPFAAQVWTAGTDFACEFVQGRKTESLPDGSLEDGWPLVDADIAGQSKDFAWAGHPGGTVRVCATDEDTWSMDNLDASFVMGATNAVSLWISLAGDPVDAVQRSMKSADMPQSIQVPGPTTDNHWNGYRLKNADAGTQVTLLTRVHNGVTHVRYIGSSKRASKSTLVSMTVLPLSPELFRIPDRPGAIVSAYGTHTEFARTIFVHDTDEQSWPDGVGVIGPMK